MHGRRRAPGKAAACTHRWRSRLRRPSISWPPSPVPFLGPRPFLAEMLSDLPSDVGAGFPRPWPSAHLVCLQEGRGDSSDLLKMLKAQTDCLHPVFTVDGQDSTTPWTITFSYFSDRPAFGLLRASLALSGRQDGRFRARHAVDSFLHPPPIESPPEALASRTPAASHRLPCTSFYCFVNGN